MPPGIYYRFDVESRQDDFDVMLPQAVVTTAVMNRTFAALESLIDRGAVDASRASLEYVPGKRWLCLTHPLATAP